MYSTVSSTFVVVNVSHFTCFTSKLCLCMIISVSGEIERGDIETAQAASVLAETALKALSTDAVNVGEISKLFTKIGPAFPVLSSAFSLLLSQYDSSELVYMQKQFQKLDSHIEKLIDKVDRAEENIISQMAWSKYNRIVSEPVKLLSAKGQLIFPNASEYMISEFASTCTQNNALDSIFKLEIYTCTNDDDENMMKKIILGSDYDVNVYDTKLKRIAADLIRLMKLQSLCSATRGATAGDLKKISDSLNAHVLNISECMYSHRYYLTSNAVSQQLDQDIRGILETNKNSNVTSTAKHLADFLTKKYNWLYFQTLVLDKIDTIYTKCNNCHVIENHFGKTAVVMHENATYVFNSSLFERVRNRLLNIVHDKFYSNVLCDIRCDPWGAVKHISNNYINNANVVWIIRPRNAQVTAWGNPYLKLIFHPSYTLYGGMFGFWEFFKQVDLTFCATIHE